MNLVDIFPMDRLPLSARSQVKFTDCEIIEVVYFQRPQFTERELINTEQQAYIIHKIIRDHYKNTLLEFAIVHLPQSDYLKNPMIKLYLKENGEFKEIDGTEWHERVFLRYGELLAKESAMICRSPYEPWLINYFWESAA